MAFATTPMFGNGTTGTASFSYDALDNLTKLVMPATATSAARTQYYCYDSEVGWVERSDTHRP